MYYVGKLAETNKRFDSCASGKPFRLCVGRGEVIKGWDTGLIGKWTAVTSPSYLATPAVFDVCLMFTCLQVVLHSIGIGLPASRGRVISGPVAS